MCVCGWGGDCHKSSTRGGRGSSGASKDMCAGVHQMEVMPCPSGTARLVLGDIVS